MDVLVERVAGMDISKRDAKVCVRVPAARVGTFTRTVTTYGATMREVERLRADLEAAGIELVVMEATGDYWKPFFFVLADTLHVELVNAKQARNIPGRKTDVSDAQWLAELAAHGLLRPSYVPPEPVRELRDLTRTRKHLRDEEKREWARLEKNLEDAGVKISTVVSSLGTQSARVILEALVSGERDPETLASLAHASMMPKHTELVAALHGRFRNHHAFMVRLHLDRIDSAHAAIDRVDARIEEVMSPFRDYRDALTTIPGISTTVANVIIAEIGPDMTVFPTAGHLASWAGVCPGQNESAGRIASAHTRPGNAYLKASLGIAALSISRMRPNHLTTKYKRIVRRAGKLRALVAIEHALLVIIWKMLSTGESYIELGPDYAARHDPQRDIDRHIRALEHHGLTVTVAPTPA